MFEIRLGDTFQFTNDTLSKNFSELNPPLVERVDVPERSLCKNTVFVKRN